MTTSIDTPDWYGGKSPRAGFDQIPLANGVAVSPGAPLTVNIPAGSAPIHALGIWASAAGGILPISLGINGIQSGVLFYGGYPLADQQRIGSPVIVPFTSLHDTQLNIYTVGGTLNDLYVWGYTQAVPAMPARKRAPVQAVTVIIPSGSASTTVLAAPANGLTYVMLGLNATYGGTTPNIITLKGSSGGPLGSVLVTGTAAATIDMHGVAAGPGEGVVATQSQITPGSTLYVQYAQAFTPDGSDL